MRPAVVALAAVGLLVGGRAVAVDAATAAATLAAFESRRDEALARLAASPYPSTGVWSVTGQSLARLWRNEEVAAANAALASLPVAFPVDPDPERELGQPEREDYHWYINQLHRIWFLFNSRDGRYPGRLSPEAEAALLSIFWDSSRRHCRREMAGLDRTWWFWGSENHDAMSRSGFWGSAQILSREPAYQGLTYDDGTPVPAMAAAWDAFFQRQALERAARGLLIELGSTYDKYTLSGWYNMADFAVDPVLRRQMSQLLELFWADWAIEQIDGVRGGGMHRIYPGRAAQRGAHSSGTGMAWYYFGLGPARSVHPAHLATITSDWRPSELVVHLALDAAGRGDYAYVSRRPGRLAAEQPADLNWQYYVLDPLQGGILRYTWCTPEYIIGTSQVAARPAEDWAKISSQNRWDGIIFAGAADARIYVSARQPTRGSFYNSHHSVQHRGAMLTQRLRTHQHAHGLGVWFAADLAVEERDGWVFAASDRAWAAVKVLRGGTSWVPDSQEWHRETITAPTPGRWLVADDELSPVVLQAATRREYADLAAFQQAVLANPPVEDGDWVRYRALSDGTELALDSSQQEPAQVAGQRLDFTPELVYDSPYLQGRHDDGRVTLRYGGEILELDFRLPD